MTRREVERLNHLVKTMRFKHPFKWKSYKEHISIIAYLMDSIDELDSLIMVHEAPTMEFEESQGIGLIKKSGEVVQAVNLWKQSPLFHNFLSSKVDGVLEDMINAIYEYVQIMLNLVVADMNKSLLEYIEGLKDDVIKNSQQEFEMYEIDEADRTINIADSDIELKEKQFMTILQLRNDATTKRLIARNVVGSFKSLLFYDYIDIIRGVDIIQKTRIENKDVKKAFGKSKVKFVDLNTSKKANVTVKPDSDEDSE